MEQSIFNNELLKGENLLWFGQPESNIIFSGKDIFLIPFSLLWGGFAIFWEVSVIRFGAPFPFALFGIPFVLIGLYFIFGRFIYKVIKKKHTYYAVTNQRVLILTHLVNRNLKAEFINQIPTINKNIRANGTGTILFGNNSFFGGIYDNTGMELFGSFNRTWFPVFYDIQDAETVYKMVHDLRLQ